MRLIILAEGPARLSRLSKAHAVGRVTPRTMACFAAVSNDGGSMFQFMRGIVLIAVMSLSCSASLAEEDEQSANYMMPACRDFS